MASSKRARDKRKPKTKQPPSILWFPENTGDEEADHWGMARNVLLAIQYESIQHPEALEYLDNLKLKQIDSFMSNAFAAIGLDDYAAHRGTSQMMMEFFCGLTGYNVLS